MRNRTARTTLSAIITVVMLSAISIVTVVSVAPPASATGDTAGRFQSAQGRILDTRPGTGVGGSGIGGYSTPMAANSWRSVDVGTAASGIPTTGVSAVVITIIAVSPSTSGYVRAAADLTVPNEITSALNYQLNRNTSNSATVAVGSNSKIKLLTSTATDLVVDVQGYYTTGSSLVAGAYVPVTPARLKDTRTGSKPGAASTIPVAVAGNAGVPVGASAAVVNITVVDPNSAGTLKAYASDQAAPTTATAFSSATATAIASIVPISAGTAGSFKIYTSVSAHYVVDLVGYFTGGNGNGGGGFSASQSRILDSRDLGETAIPANGTKVLPIAGVAGVPLSSASAVSLHITVVPGVTSGTLNAWPSGSPEPGTSVTNYPASTNTSNSATVQIGTDGSIALANHGSQAVHVVVDLEGWYTRYGQPPTAPTAVSATPGGLGYVSSGAPTLSAIPHDVDNSSVRTTFAVSDGTAVVWSGSVDGPSNVVSTMTMPSGYLEPGQVYTATVTSNDGVSMSPPGSATFQADAMAGIPVSAACVAPCISASPTTIFSGTVAAGGTQTFDVIGLPFDIDAAGLLRVHLQGAASPQSGRATVFDPDYSAPITPTIAWTGSTSGLSGYVDIYPSDLFQLAVKNDGSIATSLTVLIVGYTPWMDQDDIDHEQVVDSSFPTQAEEDAILAQSGPKLPMLRDELSQADLDELGISSEDSTEAGLEGSSSCQDFTNSDGEAAASCVDYLSVGDYEASVTGADGDVKANETIAPNMTDSGTLTSSADRAADSDRCRKYPTWTVKDRRSACTFIRVRTTDYLYYDKKRERTGRTWMTAEFNLYLDLKSALVLEAVDIRLDRWRGTGVESAYTAYFKCKNCYADNASDSQPLVGVTDEFNIMILGGWSTVAKFQARPLSPVVTFEPFQVGPNEPKRHIISAPSVRCDRKKYLPGFNREYFPGGCVFDNFTANLYYKRLDYPNVTANIERGQYGIPGSPGLLGDDYPTTRKYWNGRFNKNRYFAKKQCKEYGVINSCDEYPYASTHQGCEKHTCWVGGVPLSENSAAGRALGKYYAAQRINGGDPFYTIMY